MNLISLHTQWIREFETLDSDDAVRVYIADRISKLRNSTDAEEYHEFACVLLRIGMVNPDTAEKLASSSDAISLVNTIIADVDAPLTELLSKASFVVSISCLSINSSIDTHRANAFLAHVARRTLANDISDLQLVRLAAICAAVEARPEFELAANSIEANYEKTGAAEFLRFTTCMRFIMAPPRYVSPQDYARSALTDGVRFWGALSAVGEVDDVTMLCFAMKCARVMEVTTGVAALLRQTFQNCLNDERRNADATAQRRQTQNGATWFTLGRGRYQIDQWLIGSGARALWRGWDTQNGLGVIAATDILQGPWAPHEVLQRCKQDGTGTNQLMDFVAVDPDTQAAAPGSQRWAIVETAHQGEWLPAILAASYEPYAAAHLAVSLGQSLAHLLQSHRSEACQELIPEALWVQYTDGRWQVSGFSCRYTTFTRLRKNCAFVPPMSARAYGVGTGSLESRLVGLIASMVIEWGTGSYLIDYTGHVNVVNLDLRGSYPPFRKLLSAIILTQHTMSLQQLQTCFESWIEQESHSAKG